MSLNLLKYGSSNKLRPKTSRRPPSTSETCSVSYSTGNTSTNKVQIFNIINLFISLSYPSSWLRQQFSECRCWGWLPAAWMTADPQLLPSCWAPPGAGPAFYQLCNGNYITTWTGTWTSTLYSVHVQYLTMLRPQVLFGSRVSSYYCWHAWKNNMFWEVLQIQIKIFLTQKVWELTKLIKIS